MSYRITNAGAKTFAGDINAKPDGEIARHTRDSAITGATAEVGYVRIDNIPIKAGNTYLVVCPSVNASVSATGTIPRVDIRANDSGVATTSSSRIGYMRTDQASSASFTNVGPAVGVFRSSTTGSLSVIVTVSRASGGGTVGIFASTGEVFTMSVIDQGGTPADTGIDI